MGYAHRFVANIETREREVRKDQNEQGYMTYHIDGMEVTEHLYELCVAIRNTTSMRHLMFGTSGNARKNWNQCAVFDPNEVYVFGTIGYGDFTRKGGGDHKYMVRSPNIVNRKYSYWTQEYHQTLTVNLDRALKNVKTYMRAYSDEAIADATVDTFVSNLGYKVSEVNEDVNDKFRPLRNDIRAGFDTSMILGVLDSAIRGEVPEVPDALRDMYAGYKAAYLDMQEGIGSKQYRPTLVFCTRSMGGGVAYKAIPSDTLMVENNMRQVTVAESLRNSIHAGTSKIYTAETLPRQLSGKLAVLSMLEDGAYVEGTGYRHNEKLMYVMAEDADA